VFVLTHGPPDGPWNDRVKFTSAPIEAAVAAAQAAAADRDVGIFGASVSRQCLRAGLLDESVIHLAPVLLGAGVRLFGEQEGLVALQRVSLGQAEELTDLRFLVVK
jgi:dihydrofolate reductase